MLYDGCRSHIRASYTLFCIRWFSPLKLENALMSVFDCNFAGQTKQIVKGVYKKKWQFENLNNNNNNNNNNTMM
jgi:hypothetical protein